MKKENHIIFAKNHLRENTQLYIAISGDKQAIKKHLQQIILEFDDSYGKPRQGIRLDHNSIQEAITPIWEGEKY